MKRDLTEKDRMDEDIRYFYNWYLDQVDVDIVMEAIGEWDFELNEVQIEKLILLSIA